MYLHRVPAPVLSFKFEKANFPTYDTLYQTKLTGISMMTSTDINSREGPTVREKHRVQSFLDPDESTFAQIRKRLSTLSLKTAYNRAMEPQQPLPVIEERQLPPRRTSSISSMDTAERASQRFFQRQRASSKTSSRSDDLDLQRFRPLGSIRSDRASDSEARTKLQDSYITPGHNPDLFSQHIRLKDKRKNKGINTRSTSPKSVRSTDSSGKVHLGLIESLDLNERLNDVEKIKDRYSSGQFVTSLALFKLRGHDKCHHPEAHTSFHIRRGTRLHSPTSEFRPDSVSTFDSFNYSSMSSIISPRLQASSFRQRFAENVIFSHNNQINAHRNNAGMSEEKPQQVKQRKSVGFNMVPKEFFEEEADEAHVPKDPHKTLAKEPKSILKRSSSRDSFVSLDTSKTQDMDEEFIANANYHWKFQLPKIHSPMSGAKGRPLAFRKRMFHQGDGVSSEFEQVIGIYGNCRQNSMVREGGIARESSRLSNSSKGGKACKGGKKDTNENLQPIERKDNVNISSANDNDRKQ